MPVVELVTEPVPVVVMVPPAPPVLSPPSVEPELPVASLSPHPAHALATVAATTINPKILVLRIISS
jgi:hypothetical protein